MMYYFWDGLLVKIVLFLEEEIYQIRIMSIGFTYFHEINHQSFLNACRITFTTFTYGSRSKEFLSKSRRAHCQLRFPFSEGFSFSLIGSVNLRQIL
jgi:hypothetical protein